MSNPTVDIIEQNIQVPKDSHSNVTEFIEPELTEQSAEIGDNHETYVISDLIANLSEKLKIDTTEIIQREKILMNLIENEDILGKIQRDIQKELMSAKCNVYESTSISSEEDNINNSTTDCSISPNIISDSDKSSIVVNISSLNDPAPCDDSPSGEKMSNDNDRSTEINVHSEHGGNSAAGDCRKPHESEQDVEKKPNLIVYKLPYCEPSTSREVVEHNARVMASMRLEAGMETGAAGKPNVKK
ncbi:uncharacterized protein LOC126903603 [Daktulosphaira vitifoliae]|uniref:uncharacterized protein LOC126903603 n=1 Tax=Daktulosphaira vitifoliae TaxID=58002 RepID=UPI0021AA264C|nr:uncharacterized protein LOC126903603 [Daktulosphaira vitifoliae]